MRVKPSPFPLPLPPPSFHRRCDVIVLGEGVGGGLARRSSYTIPLKIMHIQCPSVTYDAII